LRVVDHLGRAVANAIVTPSLSYELEQANKDALDDINPLRLAALRAKLVQKTGADGIVSWETDLLQEGGLITFGAIGPQFGVGEASVVLEVGAAQDLGDLVLSPAGAITGQILMSDSSQPGRHYVRLISGTPPAGAALLTAWSTGPGPDVVDSTLSALDGAFRFDGVEEGEYFVYVKARDGSPQSVSSSFQVLTGTLIPGIEVPRTAPTLGPPMIVVYGAKGEILPNAYVSLTGSSRKQSGRVNKQGQYKLAMTYPSFAGGKLEVRDNSLVHESKVVDPLPLEAQTIEVHLRKADMVERAIRILDTDGAEVRGSEVTIKTDQGSRTWELKGAEASVLLPNHSGATFFFRVRARGFVTEEVERMATVETPEEWSVHLTAQPGIRGQVLAEGKPVAKAKVLLLETLPQSKVLISGNEVSAISGEADEVVTDEKGEFLLYAPDPGSYVLAIRARRFAEVIEELGELGSDGVSDALIVDLTEGGEVEGQVRDHNGVPVPRACVILSHPHHEQLRRRASKDGEFRFRKVPAGGWHVRVVPKFEEAFMSRTHTVPEGWNYPSDCQVLDGETTHHDVKLKNPADTFVAGMWNPKGLGTNGWTAELYAGGWTMGGADPFAPRIESIVDMTVGQEFRIDAQSGRDYTMLLKQEDQGIILRRSVEALELPLVLHDEFAFATLELRAPEGADRGETGTLFLTWKRGEWACNQTLKPDQSGNYGPVHIPAGSVHVSWELPASKEWSKLDVELAEGEERVLTLP
jgi:hypothetical protein